MLAEGETLTKLANYLNLAAPGRGDEARRTAFEAVALLEQRLPGGARLRPTRDPYACRPLLPTAKLAGTGARRALELRRELLDRPRCSLRGPHRSGLARSSPVSQPFARGVEIVATAARGLARRRSTVSNSTVAAYVHLVLRQLEAGFSVLPRAQASTSSELYFLVAVARASSSPTGASTEAVDVGQARPGKASGVALPPYDRSDGPRARPRTAGRPRRRSAARRGPRTWRIRGRALRGLVNRRRRRGQRPPGWSGDTAAVHDATDDALDLAVEGGDSPTRRPALILAATRRPRGRDGYQLAAGPRRAGSQATPPRRPHQWAQRGRPYEAALALADVGSEQPLRESLERLDAARRPCRQPRSWRDGCASSAA